MKTRILETCAVASISIKQHLHSTLRLRKIELKSYLNLRMKWKIWHLDEFMLG